MNILQTAKLKNEEEYKQCNIIIFSEILWVKCISWLNWINWLNMFDERDMKFLVECASN